MRWLSRYRSVSPAPNAPKTSLKCWEKKMKC